MALVALATTGADWRQFRGSDSTGIATGETLTGHVGSASIAWKIALPGRGLSSPIIVGDRLFLTACTGHGQSRLHLMAFDCKSGQKLWQRTLWATGPVLCHPKTCMAAPTPASDGRHLVALFATNDIACFDLEGNLQWVRSLYEENPGTSDCRGFASSPIIVGEAAIVQVQNQNNSFVLGIDVATGKNRWRTERPRDMSWTTPIVLPGKSPKDEAVLLQGSSSLSACDPATGKEIWQVKRELNPIASTTLAGNVLYVPGGSGLAAFELQAGSAPPKLLWEKTKLNPDVASPLVSGGKVYVLRGAMFVTGDAKTGEVVGQLRLKGPFSSSMVMAGGLIYCFSEGGMAQVVKLDGKDGKLVDSNELKETVLCTPAVSGGALYVRSDEHLWKIG
jgi:outer membrane protein assembly factor BamB